MDFQDIIENNLKDHLIVSEIVEESFKDVELVLGIDEAGRGPVLGIKTFNNNQFLICMVISSCFY